MNHAVFRAELALAALTALPVARAIQLAAWIGDSRELTTTGVLRPTAAVQACQVLGIKLPPGKLRSAKDVAELQQAWEVALAGDLVLVTANRVCAARDVPELARAAHSDALPGPDLAERVLLTWARGASVLLGFPDDPCEHCLTVLHELSQAAGPAEMTDLADAVRDISGGGPAPGVFDALGDYVCPDCGQLHRAPLPGLTGLPGPGGFGGFAVLDDLRAADLTEHAETAVGFLVQFGAAATGPGRTPGGTVVLTPLGRLLADAVLCALSVAADVSAGDLVAAVAGLPPGNNIDIVTRAPGCRTRAIHPCRLPSLDLLPVEL